MAVGLQAGSSARALTAHLLQGQMDVVAHAREQPALASHGSSSLNGNEGEFKQRRVENGLVIKE